MIRWIVYALVAVAAWPVLAFFRLRTATVKTQYRQLGMAAGLAVLWPATSPLAFADAVVRTRSAR